MAPNIGSDIYNKMHGQVKPIPKIPARVWQDPIYFIAFGFGIGTIPFAPGTFGTLLAIPFYLLVRPFGLVTYLIFTLLVCVGSILICAKVSRDINVHDHRGMCIDEFAGFFVTMINAPLGITWVLLGFLLFRLFDIWKPWPINYLDQHVHGGFGMVLDDIVAGVFSCVIIQILSLLVYHHL